MKKYLILTILDHGYSNHYKIEGESLFMAMHKKIQENFEYFGYDPYELVEYTYDIDVDFDMEDSAFMKFYTYYVMNSMFESRIDGDSNPGYIFIEFDGKDVEIIQNLENVFSTNCVTIGEMPRYIALQAKDDETKRLMTYIFLMKIQTLRHQIINHRFYCDDSKQYIIDILKDQDIDIGVDFTYASFDGEDATDYIEDFNVEEFIESIIRLIE